MQPEADPPDLGEGEYLAVQCCTTVRADLRIGEAIVAVRALKTRVAGVCAGLRRRKKAANALSRRCSTSCRTCALMSLYSGRTSLMAGSCADCMAKLTETWHVSHAALRSCSPAL